MESNGFIREKTACFTGHRMIPEAEITRIRKKTGSAVEEAYERGCRTFICGGARGFDTIAAQEVLESRRIHTDIQLVIAVPCASQADRWPLKDRKIYREILGHADKVIILSESYYSGCMQNRNRFMVDNSSVCFCYMTRFEGGTWFTVRYALHQGLMLKNLAMHDVCDVLKENSWNSIYTSRFVSENVSIVHLFPFRQTIYRKKNISNRFLRKRK